MLPLRHGAITYVGKKNKLAGPVVATPIIMDGSTRPSCATQGIGGEHKTSPWLATSSELTQGARFRHVRPHRRE